MHVFELDGDDYMVSHVGEGGKVNGVGVYKEEFLKENFRELTELEVLVYDVKREDL